MVSNNPYVCSLKVLMAMKKKKPLIFTKLHARGHARRREKTECFPTIETLATIKSAWEIKA